MLVRKCAYAAFCAALMAGAGQAGASPITFSGSDPTRSASVEFSNVGTTLTVTLTNTSMNDVMAPNEVLTAVFFDVGGSALSLTPTSGMLNSGSSVFYGPVGPGGEVGGEWAYASGLSGPFASHYGISSTGLGLFGPGNLFPGANLEGPTSPDGLNYGLVSAGDNLTTGNAAVTGGVPLIQNSVVFTLTGLPAGFDPSAVIGNVTFQYGTDLSEPQIRTPAPGTAVLLIGAAGLLRRRRQS